MSLGRAIATPCGVMALFAFAVGTFCPLMAIHAQTAKLDRFVGRNLWKQQPSSSERLSLEQIVGKDPNGCMMHAAPWHVWKSTSHGLTRYIVLLGASLAMTPGGTSACVQLFDAKANNINSWSFQTGWRTVLSDASMEYSKDLDSDLIVLQTGPVIGGRNVAKEYFALNNDRLRFIRMENDVGSLAQNEYVLPNYEIGIVPDAHTVEQWAALLQSKDKADVLSALIFLGGVHVEKQIPPYESKYVGLFRELIGSERIRELIARLSSSDNEWVRQAALLAARGIGERAIQ